MENNIDKLLRNVLENHEEMPPSESWADIHTEILRQNKRISRPILVGLLMGLFLLLGIGFVILKEHQLKNTEQKTGFNLMASANSFKKNEERKSLPKVIENRKILDKVENDISKPLPDLKVLKNEVIIPQKPSENDLEKVYSEKETIIFSEILNAELAIKEHDAPVKEEIQPVELATKNYTTIDLSKKMDEALAKVISDDYLEESIVKEDSVVEETGKRFSLKHPIINFRLGMYKTSVNMSAIEGGEIPFTNSVINPNSIYGVSAMFNMAWKVNKKSRVSVNFKLISYSAVNAQSKSGAAYIDPLSPANKPSGTFKYNSSKDIFEYLTPFGYVTQPIDPKSSATPKDFDVSLLIWRFSAWQIGANYEHDLIAFRHKKGGIPAMEIYGLVGMNIQQMRRYSYFYSLFKNYDPRGNNTTTIAYSSPIDNQTELGNGSPIILGYNTGLGIRLQLSKRFGLNISGNYESNINSWVKDLPFTTRLSVLSVESGFFVNL